MDELNDIVQKMIDSGESEENIKTVIEGYKPQEGPMTMDELESRAGKPQDSVSADPTAESRDMDSTSEEPLSAWQSVKNSFSNLGEQIGDVKEFWLDDDGANASLQIATNAVASMVFGQDSVDKFVEGDENKMGLGSETTLENIEAFKKEKLESKRTVGIIDSVKEGDIGGVIAGSINAVTSMLGSIAYGAGTLTTGFFMDYAAENYVSFNEMKAENLGLSLDELIKSGEADTAIPVGMAAVSQGLEMVGLGTILKASKGAFKGTGGSGLMGTGSKYLAEKLIYSKSARSTMNVLSTGLTEMSTEILQHAADEVNKEYGRVSGTEEEAKAGKAFIDAVTSQEGWEAGIQGFLGGAGMVGGTYSAKAMNTIRTVVDGDAIETKINELSGLRNEMKQAKDKTVISGLQKKIDAKESEISDSIVRGNEIFESLDPKQVKEIDNLTDLADAAAFNITELNKKLRRGVISEAQYESAKEGFTMEYDSAKSRLVEMRLGENIAFAQKEAAKRGLEVEVYETTAETEQALEATNVKEEGKQEFRDSKNNIAGFAVGRKIFINKEVARNTGAINVGSHELLHPILKVMVGDTQAQSKIVKQFRKSMTSTQRRVIDKQMKDRGYTSASQVATEYINVFSDALAKGQINYDKTSMEKIGDAIVGLFKPKGFENISFESGQDVYNFMKEYDKSGKKGKLTKAAKKAIDSEGKMMTTPVQNLQKDGDIKKSQSKSDVSFSKNKVADLEQELETLNELEYELDQDDFVNLKSNLELKIRMAKKSQAKAAEEGPKEVKKDTKKKDKKEVKKEDGKKKKNKKKEANKLAGKYKDGSITPAEEAELVKQYQAIAVEALGYREAKGSITRAEAISFVDQFFEGILNRYNPYTSKFSTFINSNIRPKRQAFYQQEIGDGYLSRIDDPENKKQIANQEVERTSEVSAQNEQKLIDVRNSRYVKDKMADIENAVDVKPEELSFYTFKVVADKFAAKVAEIIFDVPLKKLDNPQNNLTYAKKFVNGYPEKSEAGRIQDLFRTSEETKSFIKTLPEFNIAGNEVNVNETGEIIDVSDTAKGYSLNTPSLVLKLLYEPYIDKRSKSDDVYKRRKSITSPKGRSKGATSQTQVRRLKPQFRGRITPEAVLELQEAMGITPKNQFNKYDRNIGQLLKGMAKLYGTKVANVVVRDKINKMDINTAKSKTQILADVGAGKSDIQFSKKIRKEYTSILEKNRSELDSKVIDEQISSVFNWVDSLKIKDSQKSKYKKIALYYIAKSNVIFPEDAAKVGEAIRVANMKGVDPMSVDNPNTLIENFKDDVKEARIDPNTVPELFNKKSLPEGVEVFTIYPDDQGQLAARKILENHWGKNSNPWCVLYSETPFTQDQIDRGIDRQVEKGKATAMPVGMKEEVRSIRTVISGVTTQRSFGKIRYIEQINARIDPYWVKENIKDRKEDFDITKGWFKKEYEDSDFLGSVMVRGENGMMVEKETYLDTYFLPTNPNMTENEFYNGKSKGGTIYIEEEPAGKTGLTEQSKEDWFNYGEFDTGKYSKARTMEPFEPRGFEIAFKNGRLLSLRNLGNNYTTTESFWWDRNDNPTKDLAIVVPRDKEGKINGNSTVMNTETGKTSEINFSKTNKVDLSLDNRIDNTVIDLSQDSFARALDAEQEISFSKNPGKAFNNIIEDVTGIASKKKYSYSKGKVRGTKKGRFKFFIPPSADDFAGLLYKITGKGKQGDMHKAFYKEKLFDPFSKGIRDFEAYKERVSNTISNLKKKIKNVPKGLGKVNETGFTNDVAVRVYLWNLLGVEIPGMSKSDQKALVAIIEANPDLKKFATQVKVILGGTYPDPQGDWLAGTLTTDVINMINTTKREEFLKEWQDNVDVIFQDKNMNKLRAAFGDNYVEAMEDMLYRMKSGRNRPNGSNKLTNKFMNWINDSVGTIMFLNTRSALLQTLSIVNFVNWTDNSPIAAAKAFANQKQFWADFAMLFNSDFLKQRRSGLKNDINADEIASAAATATNKSKAVLAAILKAGFLPTQVADSFAIAMGGASFIRNRINKYKKEGMSELESKKQAFLDFQETAEENQQSSRPDKVSQQQASPLGRIILAFANTPMQYARLTKKSFLDLINRRGDQKTNLSKLMYYTFVQNAIFSALQTALFAAFFNDEGDDELEDREIKIANSMLDTFLRGSGIYGAILSTSKNVLLEIKKQNDSDRPDFTKAAIKTLDLSPPMSSKMRKLMSAGRAFSYKKTREKMTGYGLDNPAYYAGGQVVSAITNIPLDRAVKKADNIRVAIDEDTKMWQSIALGLGYSQWDLGLMNKEKKKNLLEKRKLKKSKLGGRKLKKRALK